MKRSRVRTLFRSLNVILPPPSWSNSENTCGTDEKGRGSVARKAGKVMRVKSSKALQHHRHHQLTFAISSLLSRSLMRPVIMSQNSWKSTARTAQTGIEQRQRRVSAHTDFIALPCSLSLPGQGTRPAGNHRSTLQSPSSTATYPAHSHLYRCPQSFSARQPS